MSRQKLPWRKLLTDPPSDWQRLPLLTRGVGDEVLRALDSDGEIRCGDEAPAAVVCRLLAAHPRERRRVAEALKELAAAGFLSLDGGVIRGRFPDLAARPKPAASAPEADVKPTRSEREADVKPTRSQREVWDKPTRSFTSASIEKRRVEENREEESEDPERSRSRLVDPFPDLPFDVEPLPSKPSSEPRAVVTIAYQARYEIARKLPWMQAGAFRSELEAIGAWCEAAGRREGVSTDSVIARVLANAFADPWMQANGYPLRAIAKQVGELYRPPPKAPSGPAKVLNYALIRDYEQAITDEQKKRSPDAKTVADFERYIANERSAPSGDPPEPARAFARNR